MNFLAIIIVAEIKFKVGHKMINTILWSLSPLNFMCIENHKITSIYIFGQVISSYDSKHNNYSYA